MSLHLLKSVHKKTSCFWSFFLSTAAQTFPFNVLIGQGSSCLPIGHFKVARKTGSMLCIIALWNCFRRQILTKCSAQPRYEHKRGDSVPKTAPYCISTQHRPSPTRHWPRPLRRLCFSLRTADVFQDEATTGNTSAVRRLTFFGSSRVLLRQERVTRP